MSRQFVEQAVLGVARQNRDAAIATFEQAVAVRQIQAARSICRRDEKALARQRDWTCFLKKL